MKSSDFTILFADDEPAIRKIYEKAFSREGYRVLLSENGAQVLAELRDGRVDLLVTDLEMPGMNTLDLFPILKKEHPGLKVIVVSGHYRDLREDFLSRGYAVSAFMNKPTEIPVLRAKVRELLRIDEKEWAPK